MSLSRQYSFWGSLSPLGGLTGIGLIIMASARLSWAVTVAGSLLWVYGLTTFSFTFLLSVLGGKFFPEKGRVTLYTVMAAFFGSIYLFLFWLLCPFAALEVFVLLLLVPLFCAVSGIAQQIPSLSEMTQPETNFDKLQAIRKKRTGDGLQLDVFEYVSDAISQAVSLAGLIVAFSIVREPLSYCSLSLPGTYQGMITIMYFSENSFFPISIFSSSAGALLLLGYIICMYQYGKGKINPGEYK
ncbi:MAG: hypothetical protein FWD24_05585 [Treponema sp.]|nr:hypothetical protein [Treponema sp.]